MIRSPWSGRAAGLAVQACVHARHVSRSRRTGMTLLETMIAVTLALLIFGSMMAVFPVLIGATTDVSTTLVAEMEGHKLRLSLLNDLQTTNTLGKDSLGRPYIQVASNMGVEDRLVFRRVEGYTADAATDVVKPNYSTPIEYLLDLDQNLVRRQSGIVQILANGVKSVRFDITPRGYINVDVTTFAGRGGGYVEVPNSLRIVPRNNSAS